MTGWPHPQDDARQQWRALSGDAPQPQAPLAPMPQPAAMPQHAPAQPVHGGWQQAWQDEQGQAHYPYAQYASAAAPVSAPAEPAPPPSPPEPEQSPAFVTPEQLDPVGPPRYQAPARIARDPRQRTLAVVITFVAVVIGLWAILGFTGAMAKTLTSVRSGSEKLRSQLVEANGKLVSIDEKTSHLKGMNTQSKELGGLLATIDTDMTGMLTSVEAIAASMDGLDESLTTLDTELQQVNTISGGMGEQLGGINSGLKSQVTSVRTMRKDVEATGRVLSTLPGRLSATNARLAHVNNAVNVMGCRGILNNLQVELFLGPIRNGSATVNATVVPPGAWGTQADGKTPC